MGCETPIKPQRPARRVPGGPGKRVVVIGCGPAGLAAAHQLAAMGYAPLALESAGQVGGLARTESYHGYDFDIGGHRFFTRNPEIAGLWQKLLQGEWMQVERLSRIYFQKRLIPYPLTLTDALTSMGKCDGIRALTSYLYGKIRPRREESTFENWAINRFGGHLYGLFIRPYSEKVWGLPCTEILSDWAAERIRGLTLAQAALASLGNPRRAPSRSLITSFAYPRRGAGALWRVMKETIEARGGEILLNTEATRIELAHDEVGAVHARSERGLQRFRASHVISTVPLQNLLPLCGPAVPPAVRQAGRKLAYRHFIMVLLIVRRADVFPDQWIYIQDPALRVGRIQNFKNWSAALVPAGRTTSLGMEYFCGPKDEIWRMPDEQLICLAAEELAGLGFVEASEIVEGHVVKQPHAYPVYDKGYPRHIRLIEQYLSRMGNLYSIGRNGMHRYYNMDQAMLTGIAAARRICAQDKSGSKSDRRIERRRLPSAMF